MANWGELGRVPLLQTLSNDELTRSQNSDEPFVWHPKRSRVTLKIDVSHTDHSHVIGRGGRNIKSVMLETQCHIHFPDSNRTNLVEKSNQVSISGHVAHVDQARQRIRDMLPIVFSFNLNCGCITQLSNFRNSQFVRQLEDMYNVEISYRTTFAMLGSQVVSVKGLSVNSRNTKHAVQALMQKHYGQNVSVPVRMSMEMDPSHETVFMGQKSPEDLVRLVFQATGAELSFPGRRELPSGLSSPNWMGATKLQSGFQSIPLGRLKPATVSISGSVDSVFLARQLLVNLLPVALMFDITIEESEWLEAFDFSEISKQYDVFIGIRNKPRQPVKSVIVKTVEKNVRALYTTCRVINELIFQMSKIHSCSITRVDQNLYNALDMRSCNLHWLDSPKTLMGDDKENGNYHEGVDDPSSSVLRNISGTNESAEERVSQKMDVGLDSLGYEENAQLRLSKGFTPLFTKHRSDEKPLRECFPSIMGNKEVRTSKLNNSEKRIQYFVPKQNHYNPPPRALRAAALAQLSLPAVINPRT
ncbi:unnamed protein product [Calicophoron daubneyi]|uniref:K Homology domain-containing protein n=1 Tax=Calicophoron daubneyi TaxID=300641 RepID=A0AAV2TVE6_CALDB